MGDEAPGHGSGWWKMKHIGIDGMPFFLAETDQEWFFCLAAYGTAISAAPCLLRDLTNVSPRDRWKMQHRADRMRAKGLAIEPAAAGRYVSFEGITFRSTEQRRPDFRGLSMLQDAKRRLLDADEAEPVWIRPDPNANNRLWDVPIIDRWQRFVDAYQPPAARPWFRYVAPEIDTAARPLRLALVTSTSHTPF